MFRQKTRDIKACLVRSERRNRNDKECLEWLKSYVATPEVADTKSVHSYYSRRIAWLTFKSALINSWLDLLRI